MKQNDTSAIIVAAGASTRMCGTDKQLELIGGIPTIIKSALALSKCESIKDIVIATKEDSIEAVKELCEKFKLNKVTHIVKGGSTRPRSVENALLNTDKTTEFIAIHDGARPLVKSQDVENVIADARLFKAAMLGVPVKDTIKIADENSKISSTPDRSKLYIAQTPQVFDKKLYKNALKNTNDKITDDCMLMEAAGYTVHITKGSYDNIKITTPEDLITANALAGGIKEMRIGSGYDVHRFEDNRDLILGGVKIPFEKGLLGHSDADVLVHAVMDALLGAAALGDIGKHFPDNDNNFKNADSIELLKKVVLILKEKSYSIVNIDATVIAQKPKLAEYIDKMRINIAKACNVNISDVSVKATTEEGLGFTGEMLGISASCVCLIK